MSVALTSAVVVAILRYSAVAFLPAYAPDLKPEAQCNAWVKREMQNTLPATADDLASLARCGFRRLQQHPTMITNSFRHAGLSVYGLG